jgi:hypothetical protein
MAGDANMDKRFLICGFGVSDAFSFSDEGLKRNWNL